MSLQLSTQVQNGRLNAIASVIGPSAKLAIYTSPMPAKVSDPALGVLLCKIGLASQWTDPAENGEMRLYGLPVKAFTSDSGQAAYFRIYDAAESVCHVQGSVSLLGETGDLAISAVNLVRGQQIDIEAFQFVE